MLSFFEASNAVQAAVELERAGERSDLAGAARLLELLDSEVHQLQASLDQSNLPCPA